MAFQGIALFALGALSFAVSLYYLYTYSVSHEQGYAGGNSRNSNDYNTPVYEVFDSYYEPLNSHINRRSRERNRQTRRPEKRKRIKSECTICLTNITDDGTILPCQHQFHSKCIEDWTSHGPTESCHTCPNCRENYVSKKS